MQLLCSSPVPAPQFVSLSFLLEGRGGGRMAEPMTAVAPTATVSKASALEAVGEVQDHVRRLLLLRNNNNGGDATTTAAATTELEVELLSEDLGVLKDVQIFRSSAEQGLAIHYKLLRPGEETAKLQSLILQSKVPGTAAGNKVDASAGVLGVLLCVAVAGSGTSYATSTTTYSLEQRISDCVGYLQRLSDVTAARGILTSFLLTDDQYRTTNDMAAAPHLLTMAEETDERGRSVLSAFARNKNVRKGNAHQQDGQPIETSFPITLTMNSADAARLTTERLTVLSVAETDAHLRKYEHSGQERKANLDLTGVTKSRFRRRKADARDADFDNFDYKGPARETIQRVSKTTASFRSETSSTGGKLQLRSSKKDTKRGPVNRRASGPTGAAHPYDDASRQSNARPNIDLFGGYRKGRHQFDDEATVDSQSHNQDGNSVMSQVRFTVNIALNEDLTCSYKLSQLSACNVEGVVQTQIKGLTRQSNIPFTLFVRDPSLQIDTINENKRFVEVVSTNKDMTGAIYKYNAMIPKQETYFPILKYKCKGDLRPVPIRVQTKVKSEGGHCRVALQISSNPNNEASLSDLTIVMGVPEKVKGETLQTLPAGGVWDDSKSSVIWCVSELGSGEKFQLQARFATEEENIPVNKLGFPVLVRCQCLHVQLSDIQFDVKDNPEILQAEATVKMARRFRLSHREKNEN